MLDRDVVLFIRPDDLLPDDEILPSVVVFTKKRDGRFKTRLVMWGNLQTVTSGETYAGVVSHDAWSACLATAFSHGYNIGLIDAVQAFNQTMIRKPVGPLFVWVRK